MFSLCNGGFTSKRNVRRHHRPSDSSRRVAKISNALHKVRFLILIGRFGNGGPIRDYGTIQSSGVNNLWKCSKIAEHAKATIGPVDSGRVLHNFNTGISVKHGKNISKFVGKPSHQSRIAYHL